MEYRHGDLKRTLQHAELTNLWWCAEGVDVPCVFDYANMPVVASSKDEDAPSP